MIPERQEEDRLVVKDAFTAPVNNYINYSKHPMGPNKCESMKKKYRTFAKI